MNRLLLKKQAKASLKGKWGRALAICLVGGLIVYLVPSILSAIGTTMTKWTNNAQSGFGFVTLSILTWVFLILALLVSLVIVGVVYYGVTKVFLRGNRGEDYTFKDMFDGFKENPARNTAVGFFSGLFIFLWYFVPMLVGSILINIATGNLVNAQNWNSFAAAFNSPLFYIGFACMVVGCVLGVIASYAYKMIYYVRIDNPELTWYQCIKQSRKIMHGRKIDYYVIMFTFIGWACLCVLTCGIGLLWLEPYMNATEAAFYDSIKDEIVE